MKDRELNLNDLNEVVGGLEITTGNALFGNIPEEELKKRLFIYNDNPLVNKPNFSKLPAKSTYTGVK